MWAIAKDKKFTDKLLWMVLVVFIPIAGFILYLIVGRQSLKSHPTPVADGQAPVNAQAQPVVDQAQPNQATQSAQVATTQTSIVGQSYSTLQEKGLVNKESTAKKVSKVTGILLILTAVGGGLFVIVIIVAIISFMSSPPSSSSGSKGAM